MTQSALLGLLIGAIVGFTTKWCLDLLADRRRQSREDVVWRRDRLVGAAEALLRACVDAGKGGGWVTRCVYELSNAERALRNHPSSDPQTVIAFRARLSEAHEEHRLQCNEADRAFQALRISGAPGAVISSATAMLTAAKDAPPISAVTGPHPVTALSEDFVAAVQAAT
jgi:hypothetical protein